MSRAIKVGIFVVGGVILFCVGLFLIGTRAQLFAHRFDVYAQFNDVETLQPGAKVRVGGMDAGQVTAIDLPHQPASPFRLKLQVDSKFRSIVREDSKATISTECMIGNKFVNIAKGSANSPECPPGCTLPSLDPVSTDTLMRQGIDLSQTLHTTLDDLHHRADTVMQNIANVSSRADSVMAAVGPNVVHLTGNANALVAGMRQGRGAAGKLLSDKTVASDVTQTIANAKQASASFNETSRSLNSMVAAVQKDDLPAIHTTVAAWSSAVYDKTACPRTPQEFLSYYTPGPIPSVNATPGSGDLAGAWRVRTHAGMALVIPLAHRCRMPGPFERTPSSVLLDLTLGIKPRLVNHHANCGQNNAQQKYQPTHASTMEQLPTGRSSDGAHTFQVGWTQHQNRIHCHALSSRQQSSDARLKIRVTWISHGIRLRERTASYTQGHIVIREASGGLSSGDHARDHLPNPRNELCESARPRNPGLVMTRSRGAVRDWLKESLVSGNR